MNADVARWHLALARAELKVANVLKRGKSEAMAKLNKARAAYNRAMTGRKPLEHYPYPNYHTTIAGIPCGIVVLSLTEGRCNTWGHPDNQDPGEFGEVEFVVVDQRGYEADWIRKKVSPIELESLVWELIRKGER